jgi:hypothetical protein
VCVCVCARSGMYLYMANGMNNMRFGVATNYREIMRCYWSPMCFYVCLIKQNVGLLLGTNVPTLPGVHQLVMHAFNAINFVILCSPFEYLVSFRVFGEVMVGCT